MEQREAVRQGPRLGLHRLADRVQARPAPGRAAVGRRPAARPDARVRQRRRRDARPSTSRGSRLAFVRLMNRRARELEAREHALREPDRARRARQLLLRARPRAARGARCASTRFIRKIADRTSATLVHRRPAAHDPQPQHAARARTAAVNGLKTGHTTKAGYVLVGTRTRRGVTLVSVVLGTPSLGGARPRRARAAAAGAPARYRADPPGHRGQRSSATPEIRVPPRRDAHARHRGLGQAHGARRRARSRSTTSASRRGRRARSGAASSFG